MHLSLTRVCSVLLAAGFLLAGCGKKTPPTIGPASPTPTPVDPHATSIGLFISQSGAQASFGNDAIKGANLAIKEINAAGGVLGHPLQLVVRDTQSSTDVTKQVVTDLIKTDKVDLLIGEIATDRSMAAAPIAQENGVVMITPGATHEALTAVGDFIFRVCYTDVFQAITMSKFARSVDAQKAAILYDPSSPYGSDLAAIFRSDFETRGGQVVAQANYRAGDKDFSAQLTAIKAQLPDVVFLPSYYTEAALIIKQARALGLDMPFLGTDGWDSPEFLTVGGKAVDNCYFSCHFAADRSTPQVDAFVAAYKNAYGAPPPPIAALTYDSIYLAADALKRAGEVDSAKLKTALADTKGFVGVTGSVTFDNKRNPTKPAIVIRVENGAFTYLETTEPRATPTPVPSATPAPSAAPSTSPTATPAS